MLKKGQVPGKGADKSELNGTEEVDEEMEDV